MAKVLVAGHQGFEWWAPAWANALRDQGHGVEFLDMGQFSRGGVWGHIQSRLMLGPQVAAANAGLLRAASRFSPDVVLVHNLYVVRPSTVSTLAEKAWVTSFCHDDPFGPQSHKAFFRYMRQAIPHYHSHHVLINDCLTDYPAVGGRNVRHMLPYYVPTAHYPRSKQAGAPEVMFIGHCEPDKRVGYLSTLVEAGIPLKVYGPPKYWDRYMPASVRRQLGQIRPILGDAYCQMLSSARVCLSFYSGWNRGQITYRPLEVMACGGFMLSERTPLMCSLFKEGEEADYFSSGEELLDKVRFYLANDSARLRIAENGRRACTSRGHDVHSRIAAWWRDIETFRAESAAA